MDLNTFIHWYFNEFQLTELYQNMQKISEDSPWHRERSVATHTDMVVAEYIRRSNEESKETILGGMATVFHDVGKPGSVQHKWKEERGDYKSFNGHEQVSARLWENWAVQNWQLLVEKFNFAAEDIYRVGYMIEFHKPWDIKQKEKLDAMALTLLMLNIDHTFIEVVKSDTSGRMSDDASTKRMKVHDWCVDLESRYTCLYGHSAIFERHNRAKKPVMYVPIGASGTGKSSLFNKLSSTLDLNVFSLDLMRHELYGEDYEVAFQKSTEDNHFRSTCNERFRELLRENKDLFLDNTNTSRKNRRFYLDEARRRGYHLVAVLMPVTICTVLDRQTTRKDKTVPADAVTRQYMGLQLPQYLEFDDIQVLDSNLK